MKTYKEFIKENLLQKFASNYFRSKQDDEWLAYKYNYKFYSSIKKYFNDPRILINFSSSIKPKETWHKTGLLDTPKGFYCYPLKKISKTFNKFLAKVDFPFAYDRHYCNVFTHNLNILDLDTINSEKKQNELIDKLCKANNISYKVKNEIIEYITDHNIKTSNNKNNPYGNFVYIFAKRAAKDDISKWAKIFMNAGYFGLDDTKGVIYYGEPIQVCIFRLKDLKLVETIEMTGNKPEDIFDDIMHFIQNINLYKRISKTEFKLDTKILDLAKIKGDDIYWLFIYIHDTRLTKNIEYIIKYFLELPYLKDRFYSIETKSKKAVARKLIYEVSRFKSFEYFIEKYDVQDYIKQEYYKNKE